MVEPRDTCPHVCTRADLERRQVRFAELECGNAVRSLRSTTTAAASSLSCRPLMDRAWNAPMTRGSTPARSSVHWQQLSTDVLVVGITRRPCPPGTRSIPRQRAGAAPGIRLASCCAVPRERSEVGVEELQVGLRTIKAPDGDVACQIFISDSLDNGAGYSSHLGKP